MTAIILTATCAICCAALVVAEIRISSALAGVALRPACWARARMFFKIAASASFVALAIVARGTSATSFTNWLLAGLVAGAVGDVALLRHDRVGFMFGLGAFLVGHLAYALAFCMPLHAPTLDIATLAISATPIGAGVIALAWLWRHLGNLRIAVIAYIVVICTMMVVAIAFARDGQLPSMTRLQILVGATLFFVSDLAVARDKFISPGWRNKIWGLPTYYAGQLVLAWSLAALPSAA
jgi:uncharacterized membrane protein YhhN